MPRIEQFSNQYSGSSIRSSYQSGVLAFLPFIYGLAWKAKRITDEDTVKFETLANRYFIEERNYEPDLIDFSNWKISIPRRPLIFW